MVRGCGMGAIHTADHIVLPVFIKQHTAVNSETICGGADFNGQVAPAGNTPALNIQGGFAGVFFKELYQAVNVQHWRLTVTISGRLSCFKSGCLSEPH